MDFYEKLKAITQSDRQRDYGHPLYNFIRIAIRWNVWFGSRIDTVITPLDVAMMSIDMKMARLQNTYKDDSVLDVAGYSSCAERMDEELKRLGYEKGIEIFKEWTLADMITFLKEQGQ